jgi:hypothetical protein
MLLSELTMKSFWRRKCGYKWRHCDTRNTVVFRNCLRFQNEKVENYERNPFTGCNKYMQVRKRRTYDEKSVKIDKPSGIGRN